MSTPEKDKLTTAHQLVTILGVPIFLAVLGYAGHALVSVHDDQIKIAATLGYMQQDIGRHTAQLDDLTKILLYGPHASTSATPFEKR